MELALLIFLILLNGLFAMSEMALASSRKEIVIVLCLYCVVVYLLLLVVDV